MLQDLFGKQEYLNFPKVLLATPQITLNNQC